MSQGWTWQALKIFLTTAIVELADKNRFTVPGDPRNDFTILQLVAGAVVDHPGPVLEAVDSFQLLLEVVQEVLDHGLRLGRNDELLVRVADAHQGQVILDHVELLGHLDSDL